MTRSIRVAASDQAGALAPTPLEVALAEQTPLRSVSSRRVVALLLAEYRERIIAMVEPHVSIDVSPFSREAFEVRCVCRALRTGLR